ncbi:hypothetical protein ANN_24844 [Periplaneta americana]|uniref:Uncharacterized protein n=1 Tax=Periplaneta americana TaxID=6978 RepID=A0ABQ8RZQ8_PERAM|nr:hypothetical protein ANN_24844 [Periplaneta americana]
MGVGGGVQKADCRIEEETLEGQEEREQPRIHHSAALIGGGISGLYFEGSVTGEKYLQILESTIPRLNDPFENESRFQQDGAPAHFHVNVRNFLDCTLNQRLMGRRGSAAEFLPRSPDLTFPDFYLWGALKDTVYTTNHTLEELRVQIEHACNDIPLATIQLIKSTYPALEAD